MCYSFETTDEERSEKRENNGRHGRKLLSSVPHDDNWELYDTTKDWSQANNLAKQMPEKLRELQQLWMIEGTKYNVLPLDDRFAERANPDLAGRPQLIRGDRQLLFGGMGRLTESSIVNIKNKSHAVTAEVEVSDSCAEGVIIAQGGITGGWTLYAKDGKPNYCYNFYGLDRYYGRRPSDQARRTFACGDGDSLRLARRNNACPKGCSETRAGVALQTHCDRSTILTPLSPHSLPVSPLID